MLGQYCQKTGATPMSQKTGHPHPISTFSARRQLVCSSTHQQLSNSSHPHITSHQKGLLSSSLYCTTPLVKGSPVLTPCTPRFWDTHIAMWVWTAGNQTTRRSISILGLWLGQCCWPSTPFQWRVFHPSYTILTHHQTYPLSWTLSIPFSLSQRS